MTATPSVGRIVHYVSHGTPVQADGTQAYPSVCRAAIVTEVTPGQRVVGLVVFNPEGFFLNRHCAQSEAEHVGGSWHWPERVD